MTSRRRFSKRCSDRGASAVVAGWPARRPPTPPLFVEVPPAASGITWVHENAMSPARFLPESLGPGCAFLDYDNDGWMDIYLVNSGPCDFFQPATPLKNALYQNNRDGTFTDVTDKAGVPGGTFGMGVAVGDYDNDGLPDMFVTALRPLDALSQQRRRDVHRRDRRRPGVAAPGLDDERRLVRLRQRRLARSLRLQLRRNIGLDKGLLCADRKGRPPLLPLLHSAPVQADAERPVSQQRRRDVHAGRAAARTSSARSARRSASSPPTSTTTGSSICSSPTTPRRTSCS